MPTDTITIPIPGDREILIDAEDWPLVSQFRWYARRSHERGAFYAVTPFKLPDGRIVPIQLHRLLLQPKAHEQVDHENRNGLDCRRSNMRVATPTQNAWNRTKHRNGRMPYKGIGFDSRRARHRWTAFFENGKKTRIGSFDSAEEAAQAYDDAAREAGGVFARLNFPKDGELWALEGTAFADPEKRSEAIAILVEQAESHRKVTQRRGRSKCSGAS